MILNLLGLFVSDSELISIAGGKLTGYRKMSERIVDLVSKKYRNRYDKEFDAIQTEHLILNGGPFLNYKAVQLYEDQVFQQISNYGFSKYHAEYLVHNYGKQTDVIIDKFVEINEADVKRKLLKAEIWFTINNEMTCNPTDFFMRRTGRLYFDIDSVNDYKDFVIQEFASNLNWNATLTEHHLNLLNTNIDLVTKFE